MPELTVVENRNATNYSRLLATLPVDGRSRTIDLGSERGLTFRVGRGLTPGERRELETLRHELEELLEPAMPDERAVEIYRLLRVMPAKDLGDAEEAVRQDAYQEALEGAALFAIFEARRAFFRREAMVDGKLLSPHFALTPPELATLVRDRAMPYRRQLARVAALLAAPEEPAPPDAAEQARRQARADAKLRAAGFLVDDVVGATSFPLAPAQDVEADRARALAAIAADAAPNTVGP